MKILSTGKPVSIKIPKIGKAPNTANLSAAIAKHIMFSKKGGKIGNLPKSIISQLPAVMRG